MKMYLYRLQKHNETPQLLSTDPVIGCVVVATLDLRPLVVGSIPSHDTTWLFLR